MFFYFMAVITICSEMSVVFDHNFKNCGTKQKLVALGDNCPTEPYTNLSTCTYPLVSEDVLILIFVRANYLVGRKINSVFSITVYRRPKGTFWPTQYCHALYSVSAVVKNLPADSGDAGIVGSIPGSGRSPGVGSSNPLQHSCLENSMDRGVQRATVHRIPNSQTHTVSLGNFLCQLTPVIQ